MAPLVISSLCCALVLLLVSRLKCASNERSIVSGLAPWWCALVRLPWKSAVRTRGDAAPARAVRASNRNASTRGARSRSVYSNLLCNTRRWGRRSCGPRHGVTICARRGQVAPSVPPVVVVRSSQHFCANELTNAHQVQISPMDLDIITVISIRMHT